MVFTSSLKVLSGLAMAASANAHLTMTKVGGFKSTAEDPLEIVVVKPSTRHVFAASATGVTILKVGEDLSPAMIGFYDSMATFGEPTSVAYNAVYDELAISVKSFDTLTKGQVYIISSVVDWIGCDLCEDYVQVLSTGSSPDMVTFTPDGRRILTANEGEPMDYTVPEHDPEGSVSIFKRQFKTKDYRSDCEVGFGKFDKERLMDKLVGRGLRVTGKAFTTLAMDLEPEYIAVTDNSKTAYVTLQENNAVVKISIKGCEAKRLYPLGYKRWGSGMKLDASDEDGIDLQNWPMVRGMLMPDAIATFKAGGRRYFMTANEGDSREYGEEDTRGFYTDEIRVGDLATELGFDASMAPYDDLNLGRLKVTSAAPFDGDMEELYAFGGRSVSIFDGKSGELVWDSGDFMERYIADPQHGWESLFNSEGDYDSFDERSDDKGPEPEGLTITEIDGRIYAFVSLERVGGWMCWDVSNPSAPVFQSYTNSFNEDTAPESAAVIPAEFSPSGKNLLIGAYEASNTLAVFELSVHG